MLRMTEKQTGFRAVTSPRRVANMCGDLNPVPALSEIEVKGLFDTSYEIPFGPPLPDSNS
jgi:hypothetical protein